MSLGSVMSVTIFSALGFSRKNGFPGDWAPGVLLSSHRLKTEVLFQTRTRYTVVHGKVSVGLYIQLLPLTVVMITITHQVHATTWNKREVFIVTISHSIATAIGRAPLSSSFPHLGMTEVWLICSFRTAEAVVTPALAPRPTVIAHPTLSLWL